MQNEKIKKTKWARNLIPAAGILGAVSVLIFFATVLQNKPPTVVIGHNEIKVEIATSSQEKKTGLCCRDNLGENNGMLFVYDTPGDYSFWMKDTRIPLDIIWISSEKRVVHIEENVEPASYPKNSFSSPVPAQYILEVNAGWANLHGTKVGDDVQL